MTRKLKFKKAAAFLLPPPASQSIDAEQCIEVLADIFEALGNIQHFRMMMDEAHLDKERNQIR